MGHRGCVDADYDGNLTAIIQLVVVLVMVVKQASARFVSFCSSVRRVLDIFQTLIYVPSLLNIIISYIAPQ